MSSSLNNKLLLGMHLNGKRIIGIADKNAILYREIYKIYTGTNISITDTKNDLATLTKIEGASTQVQTVQGKNLFDESKWTIRTTESSKSVLQFNGYYGTGTGTKYGNPLLISKKLNQNTTYTVSGNFKATTYWNKLRVMYTDFTIVDLGNFATNYTNSSITFTTSATKTVLYLYIETGAQSTYGYAQVGTVQLETGTATTYATFVPNSPSVDYPSTIYSTGDSGTINVWAHKKNLFDKSKEPIDIWINPSGATGASTITSTSDYVKVNPSTRYILSYNGFDGSTRGICFCDENKNVVTGGYNYSSVPITINIPSNVSYIRFSYTKTATNIQLEQGSTSTAYEPYTGAQYPITLPIGYLGASLPNGVVDTIEPISSIMNCNSKIVKKLIKNSTWRIGGTQLFADSRVFYSVDTRTKTYSTETDINLTCTYLKGITWLDNRGNGAIGISSTMGNEISIRVPTYIATDLASFQTWINGLNDGYMYYEPATPVTTPITLPEIATYIDYTAITTTNNVQANLGVQSYTIGNGE